MNTGIKRTIGLLAVAVLVSGCASTTIKSTQHNPIIRSSEPIPEQELLDVGLDIFSPGVDEASAEKEGVYLQVRNAEARFFPMKIAKTLQDSGNWGVVRLVPGKQSEMDIWMDGEILKSDGEQLQLRITARDSSGKTWYTKAYKGVASKYAYDNSIRSRNEEPFQGVYNDIANDLLLWRQKLKPADIANIRTITELRFARQFSPEAFSEHIEADSKGIYTIKRLPATNDPAMERIRKIRQRDNMFVDTLQDYYTSFETSMEQPYREWRRMSYEEIVELKQLRAQSAANLVGGIIAVVGGIAAQTSDNDAVETAGVVGIGAGAYAIKRGLDKREEAKIHVQALEELGTSLNAELEPRTIEVDNNTVTLSGTVNQQYDQWRGILRQIYMSETGQTAAPVNPD